MEQSSDGTGPFLNSPSLQHDFHTTSMSSSTARNSLAHRGRSPGIIRAAADQHAPPMVRTSSRAARVAEDQQLPPQLSTSGGAARPLASGSSLVPTRRTLSAPRQGGPRVAGGQKSRRASRGPSPRLGGQKSPTMEDEDADGRGRRNSDSGWMKSVRDALTSSPTDRNPQVSTMRVPGGLRLPGGESFAAVEHDTDVKMLRHNSVAPDYLEGGLYKFSEVSEEALGRCVRYDSTSEDTSPQGHSSGDDDFFGGAGLRRRGGGSFRQQRQQQLPSSDHTAAGWAPPPGPQEQPLKLQEPASKTSKTRSMARPKSRTGVGPVLAYNYQKLCRRDNAPVSGGVLVGFRLGLELLQALPEYMESYSATDRRQDLEGPLFLYPLLRTLKFGTRLSPKFDHGVRILDLRGTMIGDTGAALLGRAFQDGTLRKLDSLQLSFCGIRGRGALHLGASLVKKKDEVLLRRLSLRGNRIGNGDLLGTAALARMIAVVQTLEMLDLSQNLLAERGMKLLVSGQRAREKLAKQLMGVGRRGGPSVMTGVCPQCRVLLEEGGEEGVGEDVGVEASGISVRTLGTTFAPNGGFGGGQRLDLEIGNSTDPLLYCEAVGPGPANSKPVGTVRNSSPAEMQIAVSPPVDDIPITTPTGRGFSWREVFANIGRCPCGKNACFVREPQSPGSFQTTATDSLIGTIDVGGGGAETPRMKGSFEGGPSEETERRSDNQVAALTVNLNGNFMTAELLNACVHGIGVAFMPFVGGVLFDIKIFPPDRRHAHVDVDVLE